MEQVLGVEVKMGTRFADSIAVVERGVTLWRKLASMCRMARAQTEMLAMRIPKLSRRMKLIIS
jgi:hypothetical protein